MFKFFTFRVLHPTATGGGQTVTTAAGDNAQAAATGAEGEGAKAGAEGETKPAGEGKPAEGSVTLTQAELDQQIAQAEKRGARQAKKVQPAAAAPDDKSDDVLKKAEETLKEATIRMVTATVITKGNEKGLTANGLKAAAKLINLDDCLDEKGNVDEDAVTDALEAFVAAYPEFKQADPKKPGFQPEGNPQGPAKITKEDFTKMTASQRAELLKTNPKLYELLRK